MDSFVFIIVTNLHFITSAGTTTTSFLEFTSLGANEWPEKNGVIDLKENHSVRVWESVKELERTILFL